MIRTIDELHPDAHAVAQRFLDAATEATPRGLRAGVRADLVAHLCDRLSSSATASDVEDVVAGLGSEAPAARNPSWPAGLRLHGVFSRIADTWWRPSDPRLFLPRAVGLGWDVNLGAVAVRLNLIEPDAETVPFASTPDGAFQLAAGLPAALAGATALHYLVRRRSLPPRLASHWDVAGRPDRWVSKRTAAATDITLTAAAAALAGWAARADRPGSVRAGALAGAMLVAAVGASQAVARPTKGGPWVAPLLLVAVGGGVGGLLLGLARAGRAAEIEHDLGVPADG